MLLWIGLNWQKLYFREVLNKFCLCSLHFNWMGILKIPRLVRILKEERRWYIWPLKEGQTHKYTLSYKARHPVQPNLYAAYQQHWEQISVMIFAHSDSDALHNLFLSSVIWWKTQGGSAPQHPVLLFPFHNYPTQTHLDQNAYDTQVRKCKQCCCISRC